MAGTEMMILANLNEMEVNVDVNENDIVRVNLGDTANIEVDAYLGKKFKGVVTEVANSASVSGISADQVTNFTVKVRILRESYANVVDSLHPERSVFHPGMSATVDIMTRSVTDVISVPIQSVTTRDTALAAEEGATAETDQKASATSKNDSDDQEKTEIECVFVEESGMVHLRPVKTGLQDNTYIQILSGLKEGESVVSAPYSAISRLLKDHDAVEIVKKDQLYSGANK
jgi:HlyD family secretion protein